MEKLEDLQRLQVWQWYLITELNNCMKEQLLVCKEVKEAERDLALLIQRKEISAESIDETVTMLNYLTTRLEDNVIKLVGFMSQLVVMMDTVMAAIHRNFATERLAVDEMIRKLMEPCSYRLSERTKNFVRRK